MKTLLALALVAALATPANAGDVNDGYPANHSCKHWLQNSGKEKRDQENWAYGFIDGISTMYDTGGVPPQDVFGNPVEVVTLLCKDRNKTNWAVSDVIILYINAVIDKRKKSGERK